MKKAMFVLSMSIYFLLTSCTKKIETYSKSNLDRDKIHSIDFFDVEVIAIARLNDPDYTIYHEKHSDVLYVTTNMRGILTVIMESDGTPLTYSEWLSRR